MASLSSAREGARDQRGEIDRIPREALPRWIGQADAEGAALIDLVRVAVEAHTEAEVNAAARALAVAVPVHLAAEERSGGLLGRALAVAPDHAATLRSLLEEHDALLGWLCELEEERESRGDVLRELCAALLTHERREAEVLAAIADRITSPVG